MPTDRARISFDPSRDYRSVVTQQGRVTLEADVNEQNAIASEALRLETIDIIGPCGTPDNGYEVAISKKTGELVIRPGTMYVGGWRLRLLEEIALDSQPDWADQSGTSLTKPKAPAAVEIANPPENELLALLVVEQDVTAVEDQALREVALGGPDTAARTRLMQHIIAVPTRDSTCPAAAKDLGKELIAMGLVPDPKTAELTFDAGLSVSFFPPAPPADPCCPPAEGGYLGADNQLVRVTVTNFDPALRTGTLLWGWNNASFLYRAALVDATADPQVLTLSPAPVDAAHTPQPGQVVEVLRTTRILGDAADQNYIAAPQGVVITLGAGSIFDPDANQLTLPKGTALPPEYQADSNPLFVRLWQAEVPFTHGKPAQLDAVSGVAVTIEMKALPTGPFLSRPFWNFAVRPNTPQEVYPQRYLEKRQGPTGPRLWLCDLAIVAPGDPFAGTKIEPKLIADCRIPFLPLTELDDEGGCCGITLGPADVTSRGGLQAVVDAQAKKKQSLSLRAGLYTLAAPLNLTTVHSGFSLSGCGEGAVRLQADATTIEKFRQGLIQIKKAQEVTLLGLTIVLPLVPIDFKKHLEVNAPADTANPHPLAATLIGIYADNVPTLTVENCRFQFSVPATANPNSARITFGAGIFAQGLSSGLRLLHNTFYCPTGGQETPTSLRLLFGFIMIQASTQGSTGGVFGGEAALGTASLSGADAYFPPMNHTFDEAEILDNRFEGMTIASLVLAQLGRVRCSENLVRASAGGFFFISVDLGSYTGLGKTALNAEKTGAAGAGTASTFRRASQPIVLANAAYYASAVVPAQTQEQAAQCPPEKLSDEARNVITDDYLKRGADSFQLLTRDQLQGQHVPTKTGQPAPTEESQPPAEASPTISTSPSLNDATYAQTAAAYSALEDIAVGAAIYEITLEASLALRNNDITLVPGEAASSQSTSENAAAAPGIFVLLSSGRQLFRRSGSLFLSGNRVEVPNGQSTAAFSFWAADTVISGNLFTQRGDLANSTTPCAILISDGGDQPAITGNVVHATWMVLPARNDTPIPSTDTWEFLNTVQ